MLNKINIRQKNRTLKVNSMKFPQHLLKVLEKTNPEIMDIHVIDHEEMSVINPMGFERKFKFIVNLRVSFNDKFNDYDVPRMINVKKYETLIGSLFNMSFPDNDNVTINVTDIIIPPKMDPHSREEFFKIWE
jgi:hypothetical protein